MLGYEVVKTLTHYGMEVWWTHRSLKSPGSKLGKIAKGLVGIPLRMSVCPEIGMAGILDKLLENIYHIAPDVIVNCMAVKTGDLPLQTGLWEVNSYIPKMLASHADDIPTIHISTDAVFPRYEWPIYKSHLDIAEPETLYGLSKYLGECPKEHMVIRTSIVGFPPPTRILPPWMARATQPDCDWNGVTTRSLAQVVAWASLHGFKPGLRHITGGGASHWKTVVMSLQESYKESPKFPKKPRIKVRWRDMEWLKKPSSLLGGYETYKSIFQQIEELGTPLGKLTDPLIDGKSFY